MNTRPLLLSLGLAAAGSSLVSAHAFAQNFTMSPPGKASLIGLDQGDAPLLCQTAGGGGGGGGGGAGGGGAGGGGAGGGGGGAGAGGAGSGGASSGGASSGGASSGGA